MNFNITSFCNHQPMASTRNLFPVKSIENNIAHNSFDGILIFVRNITDEKGFNLKFYLNQLYA